MNRELIVAALDGKTIQWKYLNKDVWMDFTTPESAVCHLASSQSNLYNVRIKPEPIPDKVYFDVARPLHTSIEGLKKEQYKKEFPIIKFTIKTDESGKETKHVEIVE